MMRMTGQKARQRGRQCVASPAVRGLRYAASLQPADSRRHISPGTFLHKLAGQEKAMMTAATP